LCGTNVGYLSATPGDGSRSAARRESIESEVGGAVSCPLRDHDRIGFGDGNEAGGEVDIESIEIAEHRNHLSGGEPDSHRGRLVLGEGGHEVQGDPARVARLFGDEHRLVADHFDDLPVPLPDRAGRPLVEVDEHVRQIARGQGARHFGVSHQVYESNSAPQRHRRMFLVGRPHPLRHGQDLLAQQRIETADECRKE
jgi:hypothetical protein